MTNHIIKIKAKVSVYAKKKTSNIFDGSYKSIYTGNGLDFENLREYIPGDNIRDIDWKASARNKNLLIKQYIAEKKQLSGVSSRYMTEINELKTLLRPVLQKMMQDKSLQKDATAVLKLLNEL